MHLWYKNAIIYELDVETFSDSNGDGIGDFQGLTNRLDYLASLGVTSLWLTPFYPSPNRDNGYDITDYYGVDPRLGTLGDFVEFAYQANNYGIRIIVDLVINHTSNEHPWFQMAREDPDSKYHDFYIWSDTKPEDPVGVIFPGVQESTWTYDEKAGQYYFHRFYKHQPDLNVANEAVQEEIRRIMGFWLELGVAGFRMDAAPFVIELKQIEHGIDVKDKHAYIRSYRDFLSWRRGDAILLAEANVSTDVMQEYFGVGDKMHMLFNFIANQHLFASLATHEATPLIESYRKLPEIPDMGQWGNFLRNHDELALGRLASDIKKQVFDEFAPQETMRIYDRGIRRRLAPILNNDRAQIELAHSLMFTLPGTPILRYGQEIGMGENLSLPERNSVRTPMQWTPEKNAGFSKAPTEELIRPVISEGEYRYEKVNVEKQQRDKDSLLAWMQRAISLRRQCPEFGYGTFEILEVDNPSLLVHQCKWDGGHVVAVHNFADSKAQFPVEKISNHQEVTLLDLFGDHEYSPAQESNENIELEGFGYRWFRIERPS